MPLDSKYRPQEVESKWYEFWEKGDYFHASDNSPKEPYSIVIPPPNITGILHIGHALNNGIQDVLARWKRMCGFETLWMPGTDHAGIATQNVVEKKLAKEGKNRHQLGREEFIKQVWQWREQYGNTIIQQLKRLGSSCDWERTRFTLDTGLSHAVREVFVRLFEDGLIYKGKRIIHWCPRCETALSDEESEPRESKGHLWHIRYPYASGDGHVIVATTRPETMLGDTGVAVHPEDPRYKSLVGKQVILPLVNKPIPVFADPVVDKDFGTGAVKVTPAHDPADFDMGQRHQLETVQIMDTRGKINENAPEAYRGLDRFACRKKVVADLDALELLVKIDDHTHNVGRCYRCDTVVEPYLSDQWFVAMKKLAAPAIAAVEKDEIRFYPERWKKVYLDWMNNIRDWCISRQIWWGHRIPIWYCDACGKVFAAREDPQSCPKCASASIRQEEDVLDTWFSSWLWPFSTMGWPEKTPALAKFYPTDVLVTAPEILFFWVARMIMAGYYCMEEKPFSEVLIHGTVRDETGRKMSKSLGNSIDPVSIIDEFGADALRFSLILITAQGQDVFLSKSKFEMGRNFSNKLWNASRLILSHSSEGQSWEELESTGKMALEDQWLLSRFANTAEAVNQSLKEFRLNEAAQLIYGFVWHDFCDWYLELAKTRFEKDPAVIQVSTSVMAGILHLLHPFMPFVTEEIWTHFRPAGETAPLMVRPFPQGNKSHKNSKAESDFESIQQAVGAIRNIRGENNVPLTAEAEIRIRTDAPEKASLFLANAVYFRKLANVKNVQAGTDISKPSYCGSAVIAGAEVFVVLEGLIDREVERKRIEKEISRVSGFLESIEKKLGNADFATRAPAEVIAKEKEKKSNFSDQLEKLKSNLRQIGP